MSHFSTLKVCVKDKKMAAKVAQGRGWTVEHVDVYENPWKLSGESVKNVDLYRSSNGQVMLAVDAKGNVIHDSWSMGRDAFRFLQDYSEEYINKTARVDGAIVKNLGVDADGTRVLEIEYA